MPNDSLSGRPTVHVDELLPYGYGEGSPLLPPHGDAPADLHDRYRDRLAVRTKNTWAQVRDSLRKSGMAEARYHAIPGAPIRVVVVDEMPKPPSFWEQSLPDRYSTDVTETVVWVVFKGDGEKDEALQAAWGEFEWGALSTAWGFDVSQGPFSAKSQKFFSAPSPFLAPDDPRYSSTEHRGGIH